MFYAGSKSFLIVCKTTQHLLLCAFMCTKYIHEHIDPFSSTFLGMGSMGSSLIRSSDLPLPCHLLHLIPGNRGIPRPDGRYYLFSMSWDLPWDLLPIGYTQNTQKALRKHPYQMHEPHQLASFNVEE